MSKKYQNKYRIASVRLQSWNYGNNGAYFITICTKDKIHHFGRVENGEMILTESGRLAEQYWEEIPQHFPYVELGNFVIMPNHMHGILIINKMDPTDTPAVGAQLPIVETQLPIVETQLPIAQPPLMAVLPEMMTPSSENNEKPRGGFAGEKNPMLNENISRIVRWYKGRCTFEIHKINNLFHWQSLFHEHIIRNTPSYERIQNYIINNPNRWDKDTFH